MTGIHSLSGEEDQEEPDEFAALRPVAAGIAKHPWHTWVILVSAYLLMQLAIDLSSHLNSILWVIIATFSGTGAWYRNTELFRDTGNDYYIALFRVSLSSILLYIAPFLFLVLAIRWKMRPYFGWIFGFLTAVCIAAMMWLFDPSTPDFEQLSLGLITGQLFGTISAVALSIYHRKVSKIHFIAESDLDY
jgi:hypothetical protein